MALTASVHIDIGELDLSGVPVARRYAVAASFERELARLVEVEGISSNVADAPEREAPRVDMRLDGNPIMVGQALARAVHQGLR